MKTAIFLVAIIVVFALAGCNSPAPLPVAPTPIPTLLPATMPPPGEPTPVPGMEAVTFPVAPPSQQAGEAVYTANCAECHGADGKGAVENARDFSEAAYMRESAPVNFYQSITNGKEAMPAFKDTLTDEDRWNVIYYLWHWSVPEATLDAGQPVYEANCVACHGPDGQGVIPQAAKFNPELHFQASVRSVLRLRLRRQGHHARVARPPERRRALERDRIRPRLRLRTAGPVAAPRLRTSDFRRYS